MKHEKDFKWLARSGVKVSMCDKQNCLEITLEGYFRQPNYSRGLLLLPRDGLPRTHRTDGFFPIPSQVNYRPPCRPQRSRAAKLAFLDSWKYPTPNSGCLVPLNLFAPALISHSLNMEVGPWVENISLPHPSWWLRGWDHRLLLSLWTLPQQTSKESLSQSHHRMLWNAFWPWWPIKASTLHQNGTS